jgi:proteasome lid subunit RPN8/RPN11
VSGHPVLTPEALAEIYAHARREYPRECCGIVYGPRGDDVAAQVRSCVNIQDRLHAEDPAQHPRDATMAYQLDSKEWFALARSLDGPAPAKIVYHSHVNVGAYFSPTDQEAAVMGDEPAFDVEYVVVDVKADGAHGAAQFAWNEGSKCYLEVRRY